MLDRLAKSMPLTEAQHQQRVEAAQASAARRRKSAESLASRGIHPDVAAKIAEVMHDIGDVHSCDAMKGKCMDASRKIAQAIDGMTYTDEYDDTVKVEAHPVQLWDAPSEIAHNPMAHGHYVVRVTADGHHYTIDPTAAQGPGGGRRAARLMAVVRAVARLGRRFSARARA